MPNSKSFEHAGLRIEIEPDPTPRSPRDQIDRLGRLVFWHSTAILGDEPPLKINTVAPELARSRNSRLWLPLWVLEADGKLALRIGRPHDPDARSAQGLIYATAQSVRRRLRLFYISRRAAAEATAILLREVEDYVQFIRHEMIRFVLFDQDGEAIDRRGGFFTEAYASEEARWLAEYHAAHLARYAPHRLSTPLCSPEPWRSE